MMRSRAARRVRTPPRCSPASCEHHSTAMLPEPAPTSHSRSPGRGASAANVTARIACLVICPSWTNASSGNGRHPLVGQVADRDHVEVVDVGGRVGGPLARGAVASALGGAAELLEHGELANRRGRARAQHRGQRAWAWTGRATARSPGRRGARRCAARAVTRLITSVSWTVQPIRAQASVTDDTCGNTRDPLGPNSRISVPPMPCSSGSPLATTWMSRCGRRARLAARAASVTATPAPGRRHGVVEQVKLALGPVNHRGPV